MTRREHRHDDSVKDEDRALAAIERVEDHVHLPTQGTNRCMFCGIPIEREHPEPSHHQVLARYYGYDEGERERRVHRTAFHPDQDPLTIDPPDEFD